MMAVSLDSEAGRTGRVLKKEQMRTVITEYA
jgi:hypothetical protein